ncbi:MAG TPA: hypothetical protein VEP30_11670 [Chthoniobacterales bacterium]|nr:hypothetical protein [Chthoniobacterales bacterium]
MKFTAALVGIGLSATCFAQAPNSRFDGIWVGTETVTLQQSKWVPKSASRTTNTTIAIAQNGTLVGIIGGFCPGRFNVVRRSGDAINFEAGHCKLSVRLSADGKTLIETGTNTDIASRDEVTNSAVDYHNYQISGTFHRSK